MSHTCVKVCVHRVRMCIRVSCIVYCFPWGGGQDPEDPAVSGINGCSRGVHKNIAEISPDLVYPQGH